MTFTRIGKILVINKNLNQPNSEKPILRNLAKNGILTLAEFSLKRGI